MYDEDLFSHIHTECDTIEKHTKAVLISENPGYVFIQGDELAIALACSLLDELTKQNSHDTKETGSHKSSSLLHNMLQGKFNSEDLETSGDDRVLNEESD